MSKKPSKKASRAAAKARPGKAITSATNRPAATAETENGRIARALESIAASLNASAAKPSSADSLKSADAFV